MAEPNLIELELPRLRMSALTWGPQDGRLALCVHGFPDSAHNWREFAPLLVAKGFRVVAPFTRGYAPTGPAPDGDYHLGALMSDLVELHAHLGAPDDAVLIGHDWGAFAANGLAAYAGSPFNAHIALAVPPVRAIDNSRRGLARNLHMLAIQLRRSWYILFFQLPFIPERVVHRVIPRLWKDWSPRGVDVDDGVSATLTALPSLTHRKAAVSYYRSLARFTSAAPQYAGLHRFRFRLPCHPLLVLLGEQDGAIQVEYLDGLIDALPPGSRVRTIPDAGHFLQVDQPEATATAVLEYLKAV
ncbi:alpha/beta fold hydrolase [Mycobacterium paraterrae]|uniref:Alpha/beta fold hydrolase n=1 Tax=Mycobacterium paraterrae TaxID=577492 RepID=A0ABY3VJY1_9MYCO|nr:alpha/beta fold hydrolase [Mycobacterium paraterrae]UMB69715.1 alpha/beta fold hydrolase [Mycobacterium paraterrae]